MDFFFHLFRLELNPMRVLCMFELYVHLFSTYFPTCVYCVTSRFIFRLKVDSTAGETTKYFFPFCLEKPVSVLAIWEHVYISKPYY